ncbi:GTP-binding protein [Kitasatospora sp. HPMI-4]|uniref:GTP-binding protein n=1 Tax=Kitasatospora sp. HPMI-4 TaxID=3448443 RepID=UPI003F1D331C
MNTLNIGILAHVDAGKTSLTERLLFETGAIDRLGSVDAGTTQTDTGDIERERGITIRSAVASFTTAGPTGALQVNLIDTPGHVDFIAEVERALRVLDAVILVVSAVEGVQAQSRVLMATLRRAGIPALIFVNKADRTGARHHELLAAIRSRLAPGILTLNTVAGIGTSQVRARPYALTDPEFHTAVTDLLSVHDEELLTRLVLDRPPSHGELWEGIAGQTAKGLVQPLILGSARTGEGISTLLDGITRLLPVPPRPSGTAPRGTVFAVERGSAGEKICCVRLFAGTVARGDRLTLHRRGADGRIHRYQARVTELTVVGPPASAARAGAGSIVRLRGLSETRVGDRLGAPGGSEQREERAAFTPPALETVVRPARPDLAPRLHRALTALAEQDPLIQVTVLPGGGMSVLLYGEVQREVIAARLRDEFAVEAVFEPSRLRYVERPTGSGEAYEEIDRRGRNEFFATVGLRVEPASRGSGVGFRWETELGALPRAFHRAIEDTVHESLQQGLHGWPVTDCTITLTRSGFASPVSTAADFRDLTPLVLMRALALAGTRLYEPCHDFDLEVPAEAVNPVVARLTGLEAEIRQSSAQGEGWLLSGGIPLRQVPVFKRQLAALSNGEGVWWSRPGGDRPVTGKSPGAHSAGRRTDGNPLNRAEYLRHLAQRGGQAG